MKKVLFIDRDGTLIWEPPDTFQIDSFDKLKFIPGCITWLGEIANEMDYDLVLVTNQDGLGTASFPEHTFWPVQNFIIQTLENEGISFSEICIDKSFDHENKPTRKPNTGMLSKYLNGEYDIAHSYVIGDRLTDVQLAQNLGCKSILFNAIEIPPGAESSIDFVTDNWKSIYEHLKLPVRKITHKRETKETSVLIDLNLDGSGKGKIDTGLNFFNHMLEQLVKHGDINLNIHTKGDLHIDEHHTIEDTGIALGEAFYKAMGNKAGIERYGFCLPMDDCLAQVAIDFGGRPWIEWDAVFTREKVGDMPTEMFFHFFKSFSDSAKCNLNIKAEGVNEHHKIESVFKAFAKAIKFALKRNTNNNELPSTKGML